MRNLTLRAATWVAAHKDREEGQTALEYGLVLAAVSVVLVAILIGIGTGIVQDAVDKVNDFALS